MFRRSRFRHPVRRGVIAGVPPVLRRAHQLLALGKYSEAAQAFEDLAYGAQQRGLNQDAQLFLTAGHCRLKLNQVDTAMILFNQAFRILSSRGRFVHISRAAQRCSAELTLLGYSQQAIEMIRWVEGSIPITEQNKEPSAEEKRGVLPTNCPACGGSLRSDEVDWIDENTAECSWCGSTVTTP